MKKPVNYFLIILGTGMLCTLVSWNFFTAHKPQYDPSFPFEKGITHPVAAVAETGTSPSSAISPAEDVLVQKIPGDSYHLLLMAYYPAENYPSSREISIGNETHPIVLKDDGKGYDKAAGDGYFTAKIPANVQLFRKQAIEISREWKLSGEKPVRFINRAMVFTDDASGIDLNRFDQNKAVSIGNLSQPLLSNKLVDSLRSNSIFITSKLVVEDPTRTWNPCTQTGNLNGCWSFNTIFRQIASQDPQHIATDAEVSDLVKGWLNNWSTTKIINGDTVVARTAVKDKILNPWLLKSKNAGAPKGQLDMRFAPFKLTSILNRFDLRKRFSEIPAGQSRLTFCLIDSGCTAAEPFTFIVEYNNNVKDDCDSLLVWAKEWFDLKDYTLGSPAYNQALENITNQFLLCGSNTKRTNQSCLSTVRTNDRYLSPQPIVCEFREFILGKKGTLTPNTVAQIPADKYNAHVDNPDVRNMVAYINANKKAIINDDYTIPKTFPDSSTFFLAGVAHILGNTVGDPNIKSVYFWDGVEERHTKSFITNSTTRQVFSLNTCTGCHAGELQTNFTHVDPVFFGTEATLSGFLTGRPGQGGAYDADLNPDNDSMMVKDPALRPSADNPAIRFFNDILRRAKDLKNIVTSPCGDVFQLRDELMFHPTSMVH